MTCRAYVLILVATVLDMCIWGLLQTPCPYFSRAVLYTLICTHASAGALGIATGAALLPFFFLGDSMGADLFIIIPLGALLYYGRFIADIPFWGLVGAIFSAVVLQSLLLEGLIGRVPLGGKMLLFAFLGSLSMVYFNTGSQGNRSR